MYLAMEAWQTSKPSFINSPWIRGAPQSGLVGYWIGRIEMASGTNELLWGPNRNGPTNSSCPPMGGTSPVRLWRWAPPWVCWKYCKSWFDQRTFIHSFSKRDNILEMSQRRGGSAWTALRRASTDSLHDTVTRVHSCMNYKRSPSFLSTTLPPEPSWLSSAITCNRRRIVF